MNTARYYISMFVLALLIGSVVYAVTPDQADAYGNCYQLDICCIEYNCNANCADPFELNQYRDLWYDHSGPCVYGCTENLGCSQLCFSNPHCLP